MSRPVHDDWDGDVPIFEGFGGLVLFMALGGVVGVLIAMLWGPRP